MSRIVFACVENSCRSQIVEGFTRYYGAGKFEFFREVRDQIKEKVLKLLLEDLQLQGDIKNSTSS